MFTRKPLANHNIECSDLCNAARGSEFLATLTQTITQYELISGYVVNTTDAFTTEILQLWSEISYEANVNSTDHFLSLPLWHNSLIRIDNRPVYYKSWSCKGIQNVADLLKDPYTFLSSRELQERYNVKTNFLVLHGLKSFFKSLRERRSLSTTSSQSFLQSFLKAKKSTKVVYEKLVTIKQKTDPFSKPGKMVG